MSEWDKRFTPFGEDHWQKAQEMVGLLFKMDGAGRFSNEEADVDRGWNARNEINSALGVSNQDPVDIGKIIFLYDLLLASFQLGKQLGEKRA